MATAAEIQEQIREAEAELERSAVAKRAAYEAVSAAKERQRLRRELDEIQAGIRSNQHIESMRNSYRDEIDADRAGDHLPGDEDSRSTRRDPAPSADSSGVQIANCRDAVFSGEQEWRIEGMSWLENALEQNGQSLAMSECFTVGHHDFCLMYQPSSEQQMNDPEDQFDAGAKGSLVVQHASDAGLAFRYSFYVKRGDEWVQWGETANACDPLKDTLDWVFGPDVEEHDGEAADGVFGLSHEELLSSEWVENDTLTVKVKLEVRVGVGIGHLASSDRRVVDVPPNTMAAEFLALLEGGEGSDVVCVVEGQELNVHSQLLCGRCVRQPGSAF